MAGVPLVEGASMHPLASSTFTIDEEDHTLANSLRFFLNKKWAFMLLVDIQTWSLW